MHNVVEVAIVDARKDLFHQLCCVFLGEVTFIDYEIEELASFADFCYDIVPFLIFKEFIYFDNVGVIEVFQIIDLVEEHQTFFLLHLRLPQDFDSSLDPRNFVHAYPYLSERASSQYFPYPIEVLQPALSF